MIQRLNPYGRIIELCSLILMVLTLAIVCGAILGMEVSKQLNQPEMRVLSSYEAMDRGWAAAFER